MGVGEVAGLNEDPGPSAKQRHAARAEGVRSLCLRPEICRLRLHLCGF